MKINNKSKIDYKIKSFVFGVLSTWFLLFSAKDNEYFPYRINFPTIVIAFMALGMIWFFVLVNKQETIWKLHNKYNGKWYIEAGILSAVFTAFVILGKQFVYNEDHDKTVSILRTATDSIPNACMMTLIVVGGMSFFYYLLKLLLFFGMTGNKNINAYGIIDKCASFLMGRCSFIKVFLVIFVCWLPHLIIRYPGQMVNDSWKAYRQYIGATGYSTQHPIIFTRYLGRLIDFGKNVFGRADIGLFILVVIQFIFTILVFSYLIYILKKIKVSKYICFGLMLVLMLVPFFVSYTTVILTDGVYCPALLLLVCELVWYIYAEKKSGINKASISEKVWHVLAVIIGITGTFFRYNGIYVVALSMFALLIREVVLIIQKKQKAAKTILLCLFIFGCLFVGKVYTAGLVEKYDAQSNNRALYSVAIQQIGRCAYDNCISDDEWNAMSGVIVKDKEYIVSRYNPLNIDDIKGAFAPFNATKEQKIAFIKTWIKLGVKHPKTYIAAFMEMNYCLFSPLAENERYMQYLNKYAIHNDYNMVGAILETEPLETEKTKIVKYYQVFSTIPILGLITKQAVYVFILLGICVCSLYYKKYNVLVVAMPMLVTLLICLVGPANILHPRYTFPIMEGVPLLIGVYLIEVEGKRNC